MVGQLDENTPFKEQTMEEQIDNYTNGRYPIGYILNNDGYKGRYVPLQEALSYLTIQACKYVSFLFKILLILMLTPKTDVVCLNPQCLIPQLYVSVYGLMVLKLLGVQYLLD